MKFNNALFRSVDFFSFFVAPCKIKDLKSDFCSIDTLFGSYTGDTHVEFTLFVYYLPHSGLVEAKLFFNLF